MMRDERRVRTDHGGLTRCVRLAKTQNRRRGGKERTLEASCRIRQQRSGLQKHRYGAEHMGLPRRPIPRRTRASLTELAERVSLEFA